MKQLFVKDILLFKAQKRSYLLITAMMIIFAVMNSTEFIGFVVGYISIMFTMLSLSTLSYDEYDHGFTFLFTLPFSKKEYVAEKYILSIACGSAGSLIGLILAFIMDSFSPNAGTDIFGTGISVAVPMLLVDALAVSVMIPMRIKFGNEHGRTISGLIVGIIIAAVIVFANFLPENAEAAMDEIINDIDPAKAIICIVLATAALTAVSWFISVRIIEKKEF